MNTVRWGLLATAHINRRLIPAIRASKRAQLVAVSSRNYDHALAYAAEWEIPRAFGSYEEQLASDEIDAVYISLPNHLHAEWTIRALEAGKHVLCEKPFATSLAEVDQMIAASQRTGRVLAEAFMYRHHPQTKLVGEYVRSGKLGEVSLVRGVFSYFMENRDGNVRLVPEYGGGAMWDVGVYPLSFAQYLLGAPDTVTALQQIGPTGVDEDFTGQMHYSGGQMAQIACSFRTPYQTSVEVYGSLGRISLNRPFTNINEKGHEVLFTPLEGRVQKLSARSIDAYQCEVDDFCAAVLDGKPGEVSLAETRLHVQSALALYEAARSGQVVPLSAVPGSQK